MRFATKLSALTLAVAGLATAAGAQAQSIDVRVTGTITPAACVPNLSSGGVVDYGTISGESLNMTSFNVLPEQSVPFSIVCDAPTSVAVRTVDNRAASQVADIQKAISADAQANNNYGLGTVSGANVGGYIMTMAQGAFTADGESVFTVLTNDRTAPTISWTNTTGVLNHDANSAFSWSATSGGNPVAFSSLNGTLAVQAVLNRGEDLPLTDEVNLDGLATLELLYL
ncbi:DUF1120 domain-containing protein [Oceanisphaera sp. KMM 10153]|uniref:DUF1120 domain-containing protein n=1 Tax=Oceanisphaera submarina TaxID=3390193 RepID=UPI0039759E8E